MQIDVKITYRNDKLKAAREAVGLSQSQLATTTGITVKMVQHYEQGVRDLNGAKLSVILKLCAALRCKVEDILTDTETISLLSEYEKAGQSPFVPGTWRQTGDGKLEFTPDE